ncbi:hypothetical protein PR048_028466 [Dryococelus australis]|uniref:Uncharacterized protein n=1 Tax=Dryococelus australis TaxID=614101 RepID=A0ABQ9GAM5_9NEOP|nr:hypothetical protein PR048_028466 [Dryococelus australis]
MNPEYVIDFIRAANKRFQEKIKDHKNPLSGTENTCTKGRTGGRNQSRRLLGRASASGEIYPRASCYPKGPARNPENWEKPPVQQGNQLIHTTCSLNSRYTTHDTNLYYK